MRRKLGMLLAGSALMATPAAAQNAASLLQAADKAIGASAVNSVVYAGTGWMGAVGQSFATAGKYRVTGEFNNDNLLERVITWISEPVLGDMMVEIRYSDYRDVGGGAKFPFRSHAHQGDNPLVPGGHNWMEVRVTDAKVNVPDAAVAGPPPARGAAPPPRRGPAPKVGGSDQARG